MIWVKVVNPQDPVLLEVASALKAGEIAVIPTETVYGLAGNAYDEVAVAKIFEAKRRPADTPISLLCASTKQAEEACAEFPLVARHLAERFWPGALTLILPKNPRIPHNVTAGGPTVGVRVPNHPIPRKLAEIASIPLATPSANISGRISPTRAEDAIAQLGLAPAYVVDSGPAELGIESTVLDISASPPRVLRLGGVGILELSQVVSHVEVAETAIGRRPHYASAVPVVVGIAEHLEPSEAQVRFGAPRREGRVWWIGETPQEVAKNFYAVLLELEREGVKKIYIECPPEKEEWAVLKDRITRVWQSSRQTR
ncbi:MAG: L-threonylcarbamoyladenylate synthase [Candidatus Caldarchaeum sp.]